MTAERWVEQFEEEERRHAKESTRLDRLRDKVKVPPINRLRRAESRDIVKGAIIYHDNPHGWYWHVVEEVRDPNDDFKAYVADDGCRYGLDGAFVRKTAAGKGQGQGRE